MTLKGSFFSFSFFFFECQTTLIWKMKCGVWNSLLLTPGWKKARCLWEPVSTKAGRWWEQSMKMRRLEFSIHDDRFWRTQRKPVNETFSWRKVWEKSNDGLCGVESNKKINKSVTAEFNLDVLCHHIDLEAWGNFSRIWKTELFFSITQCHQSVRVLFFVCMTEKKKRWKSRKLVNVAS